MDEALIVTPVNAVTIRNADHMARIFDATADVSAAYNRLVEAAGKEAADAYLSGILSR